MGRYPGRPTGRRRWCGMTDAYLSMASCTPEFFQCTASVGRLDTEVRKQPGVGRPSYRQLDIDRGRRFIGVDR